MRFKWKKRVFCNLLLILKIWAFGTAHQDGYVYLWAPLGTTPGVCFLLRADAARWRKRALLRREGPAIKLLSNIFRELMIISRIKVGTFGHRSSLKKVDCLFFFSFFNSDFIIEKFLGYQDFVFVKTELLSEPGF